MPKARVKTTEVQKEEVQQPFFNINGKRYTQDMLTQDQLLIINHLMDIEQQVNQNSFKLQQLQVTKQAFVGQLEVSLKQTESSIKKDDEVKEKS